jgi:iron complex outermembrane receptor protein
MQLSKSIHAILGNKHWIGGACAGLMMLPGAATWAADVSAGDTVEEITVTARKLGADTVQNTPFAVQALSAADLANIGAVQVSDYAALIPGFSFQDNGPGDKRYAIRGVSSTGAGTVGVYLDDVVITGENSQDGGGQQPDVMLFDMDRIEVLKGPQGTTFGSSSMTGTIRFITAQPNLTDFTGSVRTGVITTKYGGQGTESDAMINLPILDNRFAIRLAGFYLDQPGYIDNQFEKDVNETKVKAGRISAKFAATDNFTITAMTMVQETASDGLPYYSSLDYSGDPLTGTGHFNQPILAREPVSNRMAMDNLVFNYEAAYGTYTFTASRFERAFRYTRDASLIISDYLDLDPLTTGRSVIDYPKDRTVGSYEGRFASHWDSPFQVLAGFFYQDEIRNFESHVLTAADNGYVPDDTTTLLARTVHDDLTEKAIFSEINYAFNDQWKVSVGGRGYDNRITENSDALVGFGGGPGAGAGPTDKTRDTGGIGRFNLSYKPMTNVMSYLSVSQGFRSGGVNDQTAAAIAHVTIPGGYGSDSLVNYEMGLKTEWFDKRLVANGALYFINWSKIQVQNQATSGTSSFPYTGNAGGAHVKGVELELNATPVNGLRLAVYGNFNQAELSEDSPIPADGMKGDKLPYVPETMATFNGDYDFPLPYRGLGLKGTVGLEEAYTSGRTTTLRPTDPDFLRLPAYTLTTVRAGIKADRWSALFSVVNLFDNTATIADTTEQVGLYPSQQIPNRPRTMMLTVSASF